MTSRWSGSFSAKRVRLNIVNRTEGPGDLHLIHVASIFKSLTTAATRRRNTLLMFSTRDKPPTSTCLRLMQGRKYAAQAAAGVRSGQFFVTDASS
jgi:hypothetical protein